MDKLFNKKWTETQQQYLQKKVHNIGKRHKNFNTAYQHFKLIIVINSMCITKHKLSFIYKKPHLPLPYLKNSNLNISGPKSPIWPEQNFFQKNH